MNSDVRTVRDSSKNSTAFILLVIAEMLVVFLGNLHHANQQQIFCERYLPLAQQLFSNGNYGMSNGAASLYPIWGYALLTLPGVLLSRPVVFLLIVQALLSFAGIMAFYRLFDFRKQLWHIPLFIPFFAVMSVKWPDAIVTGLLIIILALAKEYLREAKNRNLILIGILGALLVNFRTEYLYLPLFLMLLLLIPRLHYIRKHFAVMNLVWLVAGVVGLLPWGFRSLVDTGTFRLSSTNDGGVLYISLGELPNNPWHLRYNDSTAYEYVEAHGIHDPYSIQGNAVLENAFENDVKQSPVGYAEKTGYNIASAFWKGVYTGEYANLFMTKSERDSIDQRINTTHGITSKLHVVTSLPISKQIPIEIEKLLQFCFMIGFLLLMLMAIRNILKDSKQRELNTILLLCGGVILYKLLLVGFIQYEPRHINPVYLLVLGCALAGFVKRRALE